MSVTAATTRLTLEHVTPATDVLARAFFDDPIFAWMEPDEKRRPLTLTWMMRVGTQYGALFGELHGTADGLRGAAVWLPPDNCVVRPERLEEAGFVDPAAAIGTNALERFGMFMEHAEQLHHRELPGPHWYLMILGVDPPHQGRGVGGTILQPVLEQADRERLSCYLETAKERNLPFYRKHGFEVVHDGRLPEGGPRFWTMRREPRTNV